jgi:hypothetical protein
MKQIDCTLVINNHLTNWLCARSRSRLPTAWCSTPTISIVADLLVINKIDLAPHVGASLQKMETDARRMRGDRPFVMTNLRQGEGLPAIVRFIETSGGLGH